MLHPTEKDIHAALDYGRFLSGQDCTPEQRMISDLTKEVSRLTLAVFDREAALINKVSELERELEKSKSILQWIDQNPEAFERIVVRKSWGRKVWWRGPDGHHSDTLRECVERAKKTYPLLPNV